MTTQKWLDPILRERKPLEPIKTNVQPSLRPLSGIKAVVFDVYGTLIVSGSGDVGSVDQTDRTGVLRDAFKEAGIDEAVAEMITWHDFLEAVELENASRRNSGCESPEVDVISIWRNLLETRGWSAEGNSVSKIIRLAT
ncbi:MAG: hypothetical protein ACPHL6_12765, partial [Rubripirellula sp.]